MHCMGFPVSSLPRKANETSESYFTFKLYLMCQLEADYLVHTEVSCIFQSKTELQIICCAYSHRIQLDCKFLTDCLKVVPMAQSLFIIRHFSHNFLRNCRALSG